MITKIDVAKYAAKLTVASVAQMAIARVLICTTSLEEDSIPTRVVSGVGGYYVSNALEEQSNNFVEQAAAKLADFRNRNATV